LLLDACWWCKIGTPYACSCKIGTTKAASRILAITPYFIEKSCSTPYFLKFSDYKIWKNEVSGLQNPEKFVTHFFTFNKGKHYIGL